jgi:hypothetical protein
MDNIAVFVNDVANARHILQPMVGAAGPTHWVVVACPPTLTRHIGRWVSQDARRQWRERWGADLFAALGPLLPERSESSPVELIVAHRPLAAVTARLEARLPQLRVLDARRASVGRVDEPVSATQPQPIAGRWAAPVTATAGLSLVLALAD